MTPTHHLADSSPPKGKPFWLTWQATLLVLVLAALTFLPSLAAPFFSDDYLHIERLQLVRPGTLIEALRSWILRAEDMAVWWAPRDLAIPYFRPLVTLSFFLDHVLWGARPFGYHLTNLLLHLGTTYFCLAIARHILSAPFSSFAAATFFALHPCHIEAVAWISGRTDVLAGFFCAAAFFCHLRSRPLTLFRSTPWLLLVFCCFLLGLAAKEMSLSLPFIVLCYNVLYPADEPLRRRLALPALLLIVAALYLGLRTALLGGGVPPHPFAHGPGDPDMPRQVLMALPLYLADLLFFIPAEPVLTYPFWLRHMPLLIPLCLLCFLGLRDSLRDSADRRASRLALLWVGISLLPVLPVTVGERFLYWPSLGFAILVGAKLPDVPRPAWRGLIFAALAFAILFGKELNFVSISRSSRQTIDEALCAVDAAPRARQLLVVDLPAQSALAFAHAIRLARPERQLDVQVLSIAPHFLSVSKDFRSTVTRDADGLTVRSQGRPYLSSYIEEAYLAQRPPLGPGQVIARPGFQVTVLAVNGTRLYAFAIHFTQYKGQAPPLILRGSGFHLTPL